MEQPSATSTTTTANDKYLVAGVDEDKESTASTIDSEDLFETNVIEVLDLHDSGLSEWDLAFSFAMEEPLVDGHEPQKKGALFQQKHASSRLHAAPAAEQHQSLPGASSCSPPPQPMILSATSAPQPTSGPSPVNAFDALASALLVEQAQQQQQAAPQQTEPDNVSEEREDEALPKKPKRSLTAYNLFFQAERKRLLKTLPVMEGKKATRKAHRKIGFKDMARQVAAAWKKISQEEKMEYEYLSELDKERFEKEYAEWKRTRSMNNLNNKQGQKKKRTGSGGTTTGSHAAGGGDAVNRLRGYHSEPVMSQGSLSSSLGTTAAVLQQQHHQLFSQQQQHTGGMHQQHGINAHFSFEERAGAHSAASSYDPQELLSSPLPPSANSNFEWLPTTLQREVSWPLGTATPVVNSVAPAPAINNNIFML